MIVHIEVESDTEKVCTICGAKGNMRVTFNRFKKLVYACHNLMECKKRLMARLRSNTVKEK